MRYLLKIFPVVCVLFAGLSGCNQAQSDDYKLPEGYDLRNPTTIHLKTALDEISGIVFYPKDTSVFAINDEMAVLYKIYLRKKIQIEEWKFSTDADYEDLALVDSTFYALHSNGQVTSFQIVTPDSIHSEQHALKIGGKNEFETLYFDQQKNRLIALCKNCKGDKSMNTAYALEPNNPNFEDAAAYRIDGSKVLGQLDGKEKNFKPSAAAIHPVTKDLYIISSVNKCLVIATTAGEVKKVYALNPKQFKQPEGITFTPQGDMLISNEAAEIGSGNIMIFKYKPGVE